MVKNNNPDWHWLSSDKKCKICGWRAVGSLTVHYVNEHPDSEVISSRIAPTAAAFLRSLKYVPKCEINREIGRRRYKQFCYFCNRSKCLRKGTWIDHMISHTGYYKEQCGSCSKLTRKDSHRGACIGIFNRISQPQFDGMDLVAYLCDLCNFVRFNESEIKKHLQNEHEGNHDMDDFEEIIFLTFP